jgi:hypothetical protein
MHLFLLHPVYIGENERRKSRRIEEHERGVRFQRGNSTMANHWMESERLIEVNEKRQFARENNNHQRMIRE